MATYKVIQDIEAEDKLVGPLSLRQFIYGGIAAVCGYLSFIAVTKHFAFMLIIFGPVMLFTGFFAIPWGRDQPSEVWALAKIRFFLKPRRRIWDQSGMKNLVNVTAPRRPEKTYTNGLSQIEVRSRLSALANTIDSRGWAIKNVNTNLYASPSYSVEPDSDRLISIESIPQQVNDLADVTPGDDMLDEVNNRVAQHLDQMVAASSNDHRRRIVQQLEQTGKAPSSSSPELPPPADYWFLNSPLEPPKASGGRTAFTNTQVVVPGSDDDTSGVHAAEPTAEERAVAEHFKAERERIRQSANYQHMKVIQPIDPAHPQPKAHTEKPKNTPPQAPVTPPPDPAKIEAAKLARRDDLNVATLARIANDEVVISLHDHSS